MMPMNNPMMQMMGMLNSGRNPNAILQSMAMNNPQVRQVMQMMNGKTPEQRLSMLLLWL